MEEGIGYFVFGATAMNFWIPPRNTIDLDIEDETGQPMAARWLEISSGG